MYFIRKAKTSPSGYWPLNNLSNAVNTGDAAIVSGTPEWHASPIYGKGGSLIVGSDAVEFSIPTSIFQRHSMGGYFYLECVLYWVSGNDGEVRLFSHDNGDGMRCRKDSVDFTITHESETVTLAAHTTPGDVYFARIVHTGDRVSLYLNDIEQDFYIYNGTEGAMVATTYNRLNFGAHSGDCQYAVSHVVSSANPYQPVEHEAIIDDTSRPLSEVPGSLITPELTSSNRLEWDIFSPSPILDGAPMMEDDYLTSDTTAYAYFNLPIEPGVGSTSHGVLLEFDSNNTVETSINGSAWATAQSGHLAPSIPPGYNAVNRVLNIRALLEPGTKFRSLKATLVDNNNISNTYRPVLISGGTIVRDRKSPTLSTLDHIVLNGQLSIGSEPGTAETAISFWYKGSSLEVDEQTTTMYINGETFSPELLNGKWVHVSITGLSLPASISGDGVVINITTHESLTQAQARAIYRASTNNVIQALSDDSVVISSEGARGYDYDWEIVAGGR